MKTADVDIFMVPGWSSSGEDHWQSRWQRSLPHTHRVDQDDWYDARKDAWVGKLIAELATAERPVVIVAHSLGVITVAHAATKLPSGLVSGAFLVAPADVEQATLWPETNGHIFDRDRSGFAPIPKTTIPFPSTLVASRDDPYCRVERAAEFATAWGSNLIDGGALGHINVSSGHGPWPEGLLRFGKFLQPLS